MYHVLLTIKMTADEMRQIQEPISKYGYGFGKFLGVGSTASVSLCKNVQSQQEFAIKKGDKQITADEYHTLVSLNHPNIISLEQM